MEHKTVNADLTNNKGFLEDVLDLPVVGTKIGQVNRKVMVHIEETSSILLDGCNQIHRMCHLSIECVIGISCEKL